MAIAKFEYEISELDGLGPHLAQRQRTQFAPGLTNFQRQSITLTASVFTAITVPAGAKLMLLILSGATGLTIKGVTGDVGIPIAPTANAITGFDVVLPLGASPTVGITSSNTSNQTIEALFL